MADMLTLNSGKTVRSDSPAKQERGRGGRNAAPAPVQSIGPLLRERREAMGVTLAEAEVATRIRQKYLAALEADEWDLLPGEVVGRGFLRNYSTYLGLEPTEMIERRRAVADDSLAAVLVNTSAGSALPPERKVDYRPKDVALKDEGDELDARRQINWAPMFTMLALATFAGLTYLAITQLGPQIGDMVAAGQRQLAAWQAPAPQATPNAVATLPPNLTAGSDQNADQAAATVSGVPADAAATGVDTASTPAMAAAETAPPAVVESVVEPTTAPAGAAPVDGSAAVPATDNAAAPADAAAVEGAGLTLADLLPAPTPQPAAPTPEPTPPPATATVNTGANLRGGPGTDYAILGGLPAGQAIAITGRSADSTWYVLSDGSWVFAELVSNPPADAPVVEAPPLPAAPAEAAPATSP
jgi:cytoskeleton protein RodZ